MPSNCAVFAALHHNDALTPDKISPRNREPGCDQSLPQPPGIGVLLGELDGFDHPDSRFRALVGPLGLEVRPPIATAGEARRDRNRICVPARPVQFFN
jgi:hypothetical protein